MPVNALTSTAGSGTISVVNDINLQRRLVLAEQAALAAKLRADQISISTPAPAVEPATETAASLKARLARQLESELALNLYSASTINALATSSAFARLLVNAKQSVALVLANNQQFQDATSNANALNALLATTINFDSPDLSTALVGSALLSAEAALLTIPNNPSTTNNPPAASQDAADLALRLALAAGQQSAAANNAAAPKEAISSNAGLSAVIGDITASDAGSLAGNSAAVFLQDLLSASVDKVEVQAQATPDITPTSTVVSSTSPPATSATTSSRLPQTNLAGNATVNPTPPSIPSPAAPSAGALQPAAANAPDLQQQIMQNTALIAANNLITKDPAYATFVASFYNSALTDRLQHGGAIDFVSPSSAAVPTVAAIHAIEKLTDLPPQGSDSAYWLQYELETHR